MGTKAALKAETLRDAERKARCGNRDWMAFTDKTGSRRYVLANSRNVKEAMLAMGTKGHFMLISAGNGNLLKVTWRFGVNLLAQSNFGFFPR